MINNIYYNAFIKKKLSSISKHKIQQQYHCGFDQMVLVNHDMRGIVSIYAGFFKRTVCENPFSKIIMEKCLFPHNFMIYL